MSHSVVMLRELFFLLFGITQTPAEGMSPRSFDKSERIDAQLLLRNDPEKVSLSPSVYQHWWKF
jgi:hypothetical protein